uniref:Uncharacterized protein n=1 Tax=viral metagenome TaxID=1070528 RepID=A0A6C0KP22_9ZZZZ
MSSTSNSTSNLINAVNNSVVAGPNKPSPQQGSEQRTSILPSMIPDGIGFFGSPYSPADAMMTPAQIGVEVGDSMGDVVQAVKGVGFYSDQIGFGAPSTRLTAGMPLRPLGVNYFMKTGMTCSNGAEMWHYMKGITEGDALGRKVKLAMEQMGLPPLKGLAPGMIEDAQNALNPTPLMNSLFGTGYPQCKQVSLQVGDAYGRTADADTGENWIGDTTGLSMRDMPGVGTVPVQTRWIQDTDRGGNPVYLSKDAWTEAPKTFNKNGTPVQASKREAFQGWIHQPGTMIVLGIVCLVAFGVLKT